MRPVLQFFLLASALEEPQPQPEHTPAGHEDGEDRPGARHRRNSSGLFASRYIRPPGSSVNMSAAFPTTLISFLVSCRWHGSRHTRMTLRGSVSKAFSLLRRTR